MAVYTWLAGVQEAHANYATPEDAKRQADFDASVPGAHLPETIVEGEKLIYAYSKDEKATDGVTAVTADPIEGQSLDHVIADYDAQVAASKIPPVVKPTAQELEREAANAYLAANAPKPVDPATADDPVILG